MEKKTVKNKIFATAATVILLIVGCRSVSAGTVAVYVWEETKTSSVTYHYRVDNQTRHGVVGFSVGLDAYKNVSELSVDPIGFSGEEELVPEDSIGFPIPSEGASVPAGWEATVVQTDETETMRILFSITTAPPIAPKTSGRGFSISVPRREQAYRGGHWAVTLDNGVTYSGGLGIDQVDAPKPTAAVTGATTLCASGPQTQLSVTFTGNAPWQARWSDGFVQDSTTARASRGVSPTASTTYKIVEVTDVNLTTTSSASAFITVGPPVITKQPANVSVAVGQTATLTVSTLAHVPAVTFEWWESGKTPRRVGSNSNTLTLSGLRKSTSYWVDVRNACGVTRSSTATVSVQ